MKKITRCAGAVAGAFVLSAPVAIVAAILLFPFWSWVEDTFGIESVGHSGPANWCFVVTWLVIAVAASLFVTRWILTAARSADTPDRLP